MPHNLPSQDPRKIWQTQPKEQSREQPKMTLETIRLKASQLQAQTRQQVLANTAIACFVVVLSTVALWRVEEIGLRLIFAIAITWALVEQYLLHCHIWPTIRPGDAANRTGLQFYRQAIEGRSYLSRRLLQWSIGPVILSIAGILLALTTIAIGSGTPLTRMFPFTTLFVIWLIAVSVINTKKQRELKRELDLGLANRLLAFPADNDATVRAIRGTSRPKTEEHQNVLSELYWGLSALPVAGILKELLG